MQHKEIPNEQQDKGDKMSLIKYARKELEFAGLFDKDSDYGGRLADAVMELVKVFAEQGHSGMSASMTRSLFNKVADYKPLTPITGEDKEWAECGAGFQNIRCSAIFKETKDSTPYYLDAIVWQGENSRDTFTGQVEDIRSRQFIKLPFIPKTFYINVYRELYDKTKHPDSSRVISCGTGDYVYFIKDRSQLDEVFKYYLKGAGHEQQRQG